MKKLDKLDITINRMDKLARALGFVYEDGAYVMVSAKTPTAPMKRLTVQDENVSTPTKHARRKMYRQFPHSLYAELMGFTIGRKINITQFVRTAGIPLENVKNRVYKWTWAQRTKGVAVGNFRVNKIGWDIFIERID